MSGLVCLAVAQALRTRGRIADGTGELPGYAGTDHLDRVQSTAPSNAICERVIGTLRSELLDRILILGERHLVLVLREYLIHYDDHRPHQSRQQRPPNNETQSVRGRGRPASCPPETCRRRNNQRISPRRVTPAQAR